MAAGAAIFFGLSILGRFTEDNSTSVTDTAEEVPIVDEPTDVEISADPDLLDMGPTNGFTYTDDFAEAGDWEGSLLGLVEAPLSPLAGEDGRCFLLFGALTPVSLSEGFVSQPFTTPQFSLVANGETDDLGGGVECDTGVATDAGYDSLGEAFVSVDTTFGFHQAFFVPGTSPPRLDGVIAGDPAIGDTLTYRPLLLSTLPAPFSAIGQSPIDPASLVASGEAATPIDPFSDVDWTVSIDGVVSIEPPVGGVDDDVCVIVVGTMTAEVPADESPPEFPLTVGVFGSGRYRPGVNVVCDAPDIEQAGYPWVINVEIVAGDEFAFHDSILMSSAEAERLEAVVVGDPTRPGSTLHVPTLLSEAPPR